MLTSIYKKLHTRTRAHARTHTHMRTHTESFYIMSQ